jgi:hypothetical protein
MPDMVPDLSKRKPSLGERVEARQKAWRGKQDEKKERNKMTLGKIWSFESSSQLKRSSLLCGMCWRPNYAFAMCWTLNRLLRCAPYKTALSQCARDKFP